MALIALLPLFLVLISASTAVAQYYIGPLYFSPPPPPLFPLSAPLSAPLLAPLPAPLLAPPPAPLPAPSPQGSRNIEPLSPPSPQDSGNIEPPAPLLAPLPAPLLAPPPAPLPAPSPQGSRKIEPLSPPSPQDSGNIEPPPNDFTGSGGNENNTTQDSKRIAMITVFTCLFSLCISVLAVVLWYRRRRNSSGEAREESGRETREDRDVELDECFSRRPRKFSYDELCAATRNFCVTEKLGQGGFGGVYRGVLPGTTEAVAVKKISHGSKQGRKEYISEVTTIGKLRHRNLVQLLGWCHQKEELLLVYEYLPNGSLDKYLFGNQNTVLNWDRKYSIACDIAAALVYLHEDCEQRVVHRDVKASNVMLDSDFNAKLGDFGLARLVDRDQATSATTLVAGTFGYLAPEYVYTGKASTESDVFSFGAVTLEIACGRQPLDPSVDKRLVEWVWDSYGQERLFDSADPKLHGNFKADEMERLLLLGLLCSHPDPKARPKMRDALKMLKFEAQLPNVPLKLPVFACDYQSSSMPTGYGSSFSSSMSGTSASSSSAMYQPFSSSSTGSRNELNSKPLL